MTNQISQHGYQAGDFVIFGDNERGMILNYSGYDNYNIRTTQGDVVMHISKFF